MTNLKKNLIYNITYQILVILLPLITAPYVSRILGVDGVGTYSYIYSIAYYFCLCGMLGISNYGNRSVALAKGNRAEVSKVFYSVYTIQLMTTSAALISYLIYIRFCFTGNRIVAYIDSLYLIAYMLDINWFFFGLEKFRLTVSRNILFKVMTAACTFLFVKEADDLWIYTLILALGALSSQRYLWFYVKKYVDFVKPKKNDMLRHVKPILVLFIPVISYSIYKVMDKIMLGSMTDVTQVGLYENAEKIVGIPVGIITAFGTVMMPRISTLIAENNISQIDNYNKLSFKYFSWITIGMSFGLSGISNVLPGVYFGSEFRESGPLIRGLSFTLIFMTWANIIRTQHLIPNKKDKPYVISTIIGAAANLIANFFFIPVFRAKGALIGTLLAEFLVFFVQYIYVRKEFEIMKYLKSTVGFFAAGIGMEAIIYFYGSRAGESINTLLLQIGLGTIIYSTISLIVLRLQKDTLLISFFRNSGNITAP